MNRLYLFLLILLLENSTLFPQAVREGIEVESWKYNFEYVESLSKKAEFWFSAKKYDEAIRIGKEKLIILERILGRDSLDYAIGESELALYIANIGNYKESVSLAVNALKKIYKIEGKKSALYAVTAEKISTYYTLLEDYENALIYAQQAVEVFKEVFGINNNYYVSSRASLATSYLKLNRIQEAIDIQLENNKFINSNYSSDLYNKNKTWIKSLGSEKIFIVVSNLKSNN